MAAGRRSDALVTWVATLVAVAVIAQQIASKAVRDGLFLTEYEVTALPYAVVAGAVISFAAAILFGRLMSGFSPAIAVPLIFGVNALAYFGEAAAVAHEPHVVAAALYLHTAAFGGAVVSGFWSVINERFDPYTARQVMGRIAGGATVGGMLGGALTWALSDLSSATLLVGLGGANLACGLGVARVSAGGARPEARRAPAAFLAGFEVLAKHSYPRAIAALVFLVALMTATIDYVFKAGVTASTEDGGLVGFFAMFYTGTGVLTFLLQALLSQRALKSLGVVPTVAVYPAVTILLLLVAVLAPGLATLIALRGSGMVVENSLYRSGYELLYTAVPRDQKRSAKILVDLGCDRLGTAAGSGLALAAIAISAALADRVLLVAALVFAAILVGLLVTVRREYVASLARQIRASLRPGAPSSDAQREVAAMQTLAATFVGSMGDLAWDAVASADGAVAREPSSTEGLDREALLAQVKARAAERATREEPPDPVAPAHASWVSERLLDTPLRRRLRELAAEPDRDARYEELLRSAPATIGQLTDALLSGRESTDARVLAAELLSTVPTERSAAALKLALRASTFRVRRAAALALLRVTRRAPSLRLWMRQVAPLASEELRRPSRPLLRESEFERSSPFRTDARGNTIAPSLELVLLLLAIPGDADELRLALAAVTSTDRIQRGTGLEYLDNLLPGNLRSRLIGLAEHPELTQASHGVPQAVIDELAAELRAGRIGLRELRERARVERARAYDAG